LHPAGGAIGNDGSRAGFIDASYNTISDLNGGGLVTLFKSVTAGKSAAVVINNFTCGTGDQRHQLCHRVTDTQCPERTGNALAIEFKSLVPRGLISKRGTSFPCTHKLRSLVMGA
jgi:hypothetical protein